MNSKQCHLQHVNEENANEEEDRPDDAESENHHNYNF